MEWFKNIGICSCLLIGVFFDLRLQKIPTWYAISFLGIGVISSFFFCSKSREEYLIGGLLGILFFLIARITKESIGYGDAFLITGMGFAFGIQSIVIVLLFAFLFMFPISVLLLCMKKVSKKTKLPFLPFLFGGIVLQLMMER